MLARATFRAASAPALVARRGFQSTRAQMSSPYHYPEGPRSNLPFDPLKRGFAFKYWGFMGERRRAAIAAQELTGTATGFGLPFGLAGKILNPTSYHTNCLLTRMVPQSGRQRRTSRRCTRTRQGRGDGSFGAHGTCRINRGPADYYTRHTASISFSVFNTVFLRHDTPLW